MRRLQYIIFNKPFGVLSQFTHEAGRKALGDFGPFPSGVYPVGRLDAESEGLLLLTNDNTVKHRFTDPRFAHPRTYLVQVEGMPSGEALERLRRGVMVEGRKTRPARVRLLETEPSLPPRPVPVRFRKSVPTAWLEMILYEGRNRQVRRMTAAVGHPTLRLVRSAIGSLSLRGLQPGEYRTLNEREAKNLREHLAEPARSVTRRDTV